MATEHEADLAREQHSDTLRELGAHAIEVNEVRTKGEPTFAVIAHFERKPERVPNVLTIKRGKKTMEVPLIARVSPKFRPE